MWFSLARLALKTGSHIYQNRQKTKAAMSDAALFHAERMARGEESYQGKLLEARQNDYKDEIVLIIISAPIVVLAWGVFSNDPEMMDKIDLFFQLYDLGSFFQRQDDLLLLVSSIGL
ncbi:MAG TPA: hypothetical protein EYM94_05010, partial [Gammaproteobacteria bacterium]|nr:hypothetical protein [Gammaproteobacteria bacterium]